MEPIAGSDEETGELWAKYLRQKKCFANGNLLPASVGNFSEMQLLNPPGSRATVHIHHITVGAAVGASIMLHEYDTALGTLAPQGRNLWIGGPPAIAEMRSANPAAQDGVHITAQARPLTSDSLRYGNWIAVLEPGKGVLLVPNAVNQDLGVEFFWSELPH
jgi:hypothetical protein